MKQIDLEKAALDLGVAQRVNNRMRSKKELADECKRAWKDLKKAARDLG